MSQRPEFKIITCNYRIPTRTNSRGAKAYVIGGWSDGAWERLRVLCRSRSGRWIEKWEDYRHFEHFRLTTIVPESRDYDRVGRVSIFGPDTRWRQEQMQELCDYLNGGGWDTSPHNPGRNAPDAPTQAPTPGEHPPPPGVTRQ